MKPWENIILAVLVGLLVSSCAKGQMVKTKNDLSVSVSSFTANLRSLKERPLLVLQTPKFIRELARLDECWALGVPREIPADERALYFRFMRAAGKYCDSRDKAMDSMKLIKKAPADWCIVEQQALSLVYLGNQVMENGMEESGRGRKLVYRRLLRIAKALEGINKNQIWEKIEKKFWEVHFPQ